MAPTLIPISLKLYFFSCPCFTKSSQLPYLVFSYSPFQEGNLELFDLGASTREHIENAHEGPVWSIAPLPDRTGFVSGSADKTVKFWQWKVVVAADGAKKLR